MRKSLTRLMLCAAGLLLAAGCAGTHKNQVRTKLQSLSDRELLTHYEMLEMKMVHIDRARDESEAGKEALYNRHYPNRDQNRLRHLHIGDEWSRLREERQLTLIEIRKRGLSPP